MTWQVVQTALIGGSKGKALPGPCLRGRQKFKSGWKGNLGSVVGHVSGSALVLFEHVPSSSTRKPPWT